MPTCPKCSETSPAQFNKSQKYCKLCQKTYFSHYYRNNLEKQRIKKQKQLFLLRKLSYDWLCTHPCVDCNETDPVVLDYDHIRDKTKNVSELVHNQVGPKRLLEEIEKCEVRCANCHRRKTAREQNWYKDLK